jgi:hypothetical protein
MMDLCCGCTYKGCIEMQPQIKNATFATDATRIKKSVIIHIRPIILIREVSEWSVLFLNIEFSPNYVIIS